MNKHEIANKQLRSFGFIVAAGLTITGVWPLVFRGQPPRWWALATAIVLCAAALIFPPVLKPFFRVWMAIGEALGWVNTRIILTVVYYLLIVPTGLVFRMKGNDPMHRKFDRNAKTYRIGRSKRPPSHMQHQY